MATNKDKWFDALPLCGSTSNAQLVWRTARVYILFMMYCFSEVHLSHLYLGDHIYL